MLQQTRVEAVIPYFHRFLDRFPDVDTLAAAPLEDVLACWSGLGYYRRARALHGAARILVAEHGGRFPEDVEGWLALPGVGRYTAGAIVSIAFDKPAPILDGNVSRVLSRRFGVRGDPRSGAAKKTLWRLAGEVLPKRAVSDFNQALMELGALVCTPKAPRCPVCPLRADCVAHLKGSEERLPELSRRAASVRVVMGAALIERNEKLLLYRRTGASRMRDLWELPMGECRGAEEPRAAVAREAIEKYGIEVVPKGELARVKHSILNQRITLHVFAAELTEEPGPDPPKECQWVSREDVSRLPVSSMVLKILAAAREL
jgi:A/G-specific adenine glycosylase